MEEMGAKEKSGEVQSAKEAELIRELVQTRLETNRKLEYESFDGYEVPPRTQFSMLKKPTVTIKYGKFVCNMAAIRMFEGIQNVIPMVNSKRMRFAIVPCAEEESSSVEWARKRSKDGVWVNKDVTSVDFTENVFKLMGWNRECRYKVHGHIANSDRGLILVFDLKEAIMFEPNKEDYVDPVTGETKKRQVKYYPDFYQNRIGRSYNDYAQARQMSLFESTESYTDASEFTSQEDLKEAKREDLKEYQADIDGTGEQAVTEKTPDAGTGGEGRTVMETTNSPGQVEEPGSLSQGAGSELQGGMMAYGYRTETET